jgi:HK97 family phage prohead protease
MITESGSIEVRDEGAGDGRSITGYAVRWSDQTDPSATAEYGVARESFRAGAFRDALKRLAGKLPIVDKHGDSASVVGYADELAEDDIGLRFSGRLLTSVAARDYAERVGSGLGSVSLEFLPGQVARGRESVQHTGVRKLIAIAGSYRPAYSGALASVRDERESNVTDETETTATADPADDRIEKITEEVAVQSRSIAELRRGIAESRAANVTDDPYAAIRSMTYGEFMQRAVTDTELRNAFTRALADNIASESPGVVTPGVIQDVKRIIGTTRVGIDAFGVRPLGDGGMNVEWPYTATALGSLVGEQVTQKSEITSADVPILKGSAPIKTYAGGSDIAYQLLRRSNPSYLDAFGRIMLSAWAAVTNTAFINQVEGTSGLGTFVYDWGAATSIDVIREKVFLGSLMVQDATGAPAEFVLCGATPFTKIGGALNANGIAMGQAGSAEASTLAPILSGLRVLYDPNVNANTVLISNRSAAGWHEDGPFSIADEDIAKLGRNVAVWSMGAAAVYNPLGIIKTTPS